MHQNQYADLDHYNNQMYYQPANNYGYNAQNVNNFASHKHFYDESTGIPGSLNSTGQNIQHPYNGEFDDLTQKMFEFNINSDISMEQKKDFAEMDTLLIKEKKESDFQIKRKDSGGSKENRSSELIEAKSQKSQNNLKTTCGNA